MKHARKALSILFLFVTPLLLSGIITSIPSGEVMAATPLTPTKVSLPSYEIMTPILAYNDFDMDNYASALSWAGDGSPDTPYIIEGYNITSDGDCILIQDTTKAFEIRNCYISSFSGSHGNGIVIDNVTQAAIVDTIVDSKSDGIILNDVPAPYLENCTIHGSGTGLAAVLCPGLSIIDCQIYETFDYCVQVFLSNNTLISNSEIHDTIVGTGIRLDASYNVVISGNQISNCESSGVWAVGSPYVTVENNIIYDNSFFSGPACGVHLVDSDYASVVGNEIYDNARNGISVDVSDGVYIFDNEVYGNSDHGIDVMFSMDGRILQNDVHGNGWWPYMPNALCGIYLGPALNFTIADNMIWNNTPSGISLEGSELIEIINNDIFNNTDTGIFANAPEPSFDIVIYNNRIHGNGFSISTPWGGAGILTIWYQNVLVENNLVYNNTDYGISVNGDNNVIIGNEVYDNSLIGIGTEECYDNLITENIVHHNEIGIFVVNVGSNITHNIVYDNLYGIYMEWSGFCRIYGNDVGWNDVNAREIDTFSGEPLLWDDNVSIGNHWDDYNGGGIYWIGNGTHGVTPDRYPSISLNLTETDPISYEILEMGNVLEWDAYALNPSHYEVFVDGSSVLVEEWNGGNIEFLADGLSHGTHTIGVEVFHISGHSLGNGTTADVEDLTPPSDIEGPSHITITVGDDVSTQFSSEDPSGIQWTVNDTVSFAIDSTGLLTSITALPAGEYAVRLVAMDPHGHSTFHEVTITVNAAPGGLPTTMILVIGAGGAIVVLVVLAIGLKRKQG